MEEAFEDARHRIEMSVIHQAGKGVLLVQKTLLESVNVILQHSGRWKDHSTYNMVEDEKIILVKRLYMGFNGTYLRDGTDRQTVPTSLLDV